MPTLLEAAAQLKLPVLALQGANDANVPLRGVQALKTALNAAGNMDVTLNVYAGLGHSLGLAPSLIDDAFRPITTAPLKDVANWLREHSRN